MPTRRVPIYRLLLLTACLLLPAAPALAQDLWAPADAASSYLRVDEDRQTNPVDWVLEQGGKAEPPDVKGDYLYYRHEDLGVWFGPFQTRGAASAALVRMRATARKLHKLNPQRYATARAIRFHAPEDETIRKLYRDDPDAIELRWLMENYEQLEVLEGLRAELEEARRQAEAAGGEGGNAMKVRVESLERRTQEVMLTLAGAPDGAIRELLFADRPAIEKSRAEALRGQLGQVLAAQAYPDLDIEKMLAEGMTPTQAKLLADTLAEGMQRAGMRQEAATEAVAELAALGQTRQMYSPSAVQLALDSAGTDVLEHLANAAGYMPAEVRGGTIPADAVSAAAKMADRRDQGKIAEALRQAVADAAQRRKQADPAELAKQTEQAIRATAGSMIATEVVTGLIEQMAEANATDASKAVTEANPQAVRAGQQVLQGLAKRGAVTGLDVDRALAEGIKAEATDRMLRELAERYGPAMTWQIAEAANAVSMAGAARDLSAAQMRRVAAEVAQAERTWQAARAVAGTPAADAIDLGLAMQQGLSPAAAAGFTEGLRQVYEAHARQAAARAEGPGRDEASGTDPPVSQAQVQAVMDWARAMGVGDAASAPGSDGQNAAESMRTQRQLDRLIENVSRAAAVNALEQGLRAAQSRRANRHGSASGQEGTAGSAADQSGSARQAMALANRAAQRQDAAEWWKGRSKTGRDGTQTSRQVDGQAGGQDKVSDPGNENGVPGGDTEGDRGDDQPGDPSKGQSAGQRDGTTGVGRQGQQGQDGENAGDRRQGGDVGETAKGNGGQDNGPSGKTNGGGGANEQVEWQNGVAGADGSQGIGGSGERSGSGPSKGGVGGQTGSPPGLGGAAVGEVLNQAGKGLGAAAVLPGMPGGGIGGFGGPGGGPGDIPSGGQGEPGNTGGGGDEDDGGNGDAKSGRGGGGPLPLPGSPVFEFIARTVAAVVSAITGVPINIDMIGQMLYAAFPDIMENIAEHLAELEKAIASDDVAAVFAELDKIAKIIAPLMGDIQEMGDLLMSEGFAALMERLGEEGLKELAEKGLGELAKELGVSPEILAAATGLPNMDFDKLPEQIETFAKENIQKELVDRFDMPPALAAAIANGDLEGVEEQARKYATDRLKEEAEQLGLPGSVVDSLAEGDIEATFGQLYAEAGKLDELVEHGVLDAKVAELMREGRLEDAMAAFESQVDDIPRRLKEKAQKELRDRLADSGVTPAIVNAALAGDVDAFEAEVGRVARREFDAQLQAAGIDPAHIGRIREGGPEAMLGELAMNSPASEVLRGHGVIDKETAKLISEGKFAEATERLGRRSNEAIQELPEKAKTNIREQLRKHGADPKLIDHLAQGRTQAAIGSLALAAPGADVLRRQDILDEEVARLANAGKLKEGATRLGERGAGWANKRLNTTRHAVVEQLEAADLPKDLTGSLSQSASDGAVKAASALVRRTTRQQMEQIGLDPGLMDDPKTRHLGKILAGAMRDDRGIQSLAAHSGGRLVGKILLGGDVDKVVSARSREVIRDEMTQILAARAEIPLFAQDASAMPLFTGTWLRNEQFHASRFYGAAQPVAEAIIDGRWEEVNIDDMSELIYSWADGSSWEQVASSTGIAVDELRRFGQSPPFDLTRLANAKLQIPPDDTEDLMEQLRQAYRKTKVVGEVHRHRSQEFIGGQR